METTEIFEPRPVPEYPNLGARVQSIFIDTLFIIIMMAVFTTILDRYGDTVPDWVRMALIAGIFLVYEPLCTSLGGTIGNHIKGIRVRKAGDIGNRINIFHALIRYIVKVFLGWLSFITIFSNPQRRAIHDLAAGSVMVKKSSLTGL